MLLVGRSRELRLRALTVVNRAVARSSRAVVSPRTLAWSCVLVPCNSLYHEGSNVQVDQFFLYVLVMSREVLRTEEPSYEQLGGAAVSDER